MWTWPDGRGGGRRRSFIRRFFLEEIAGYNFKGLAWLFMGVANSEAKLYDDEFAACISRFPDQALPPPSPLPASPSPLSPSASFPLAFASSPAP